MLDIISINGVPLYEQDEEDGTVIVAMDKNGDVTDRKSTFKLT